MEIINHEYYVSLEVAKLLKEVGFDWHTNLVYVDDKLLTNPYTADWNNTIPNTYTSAPTLDVAQRWLRDAHAIHVYVSGFNNYRAYREGAIGAMYLTEVFDTYEQALEEGIKKCLTILLEEKK